MIFVRRLPESEKQTDKQPVRNNQGNSDLLKYPRHCEHLTPLRGLESRKNCRVEFIRPVKIGRINSALQV